MNGAELVIDFFFTIILLRINPSYFIVPCYMAPSSSDVTAPASVLLGKSETILSYSWLLWLPGEEFQAVILDI